MWINDPELKGYLNDLTKSAYREAVQTLRDKTLAVAEQAEQAAQELGGEAPAPKEKPTPIKKQMEAATRALQKENAQRTPPAKGRETRDDR